MVNWSEEQVRAHQQKGKKPDAPKPTPAPVVGMSTDEAKLNKTERAYLQVLRMLHPHEWVGIQNMTLKLAHDTRYTPDFWTWESGGYIAHEVKGFYREDARVKLQTAARIFPHITFKLIRREGNGWNTTIVKP